MPHQPHFFFGKRGQEQVALAHFCPMHKRGGMPKTRAAGTASFHAATRAVDDLFQDRLVAAMNAVKRAERDDGAVLAHVLKEIPDWRYSQHPMSMRLRGDNAPRVHGSARPDARRFSKRTRHIFRQGADIRASGTDDARFPERSPAMAAIDQSDLI